MTPVRQRRSPRLVVRLPIRVFGIDYRGFDFVEDTRTLVVNLHGAKIPLERQLMPEQEIVIQSKTTNRESVFRVVGAVSAGDAEGISWGVECLSPDDNVWGIQFPALAPQDQTQVRLEIECPQCRRHETLHIDERTASSLLSGEGVQRECRSCGTVVLWRPAPAPKPA